MAYDDYALLKIGIDAGVATASIDAPPVNVMTLALFGELARFGAEVRDDAAVRAVVLKSANPDFFIAHFDVSAILEFPIDTPAQRSPDNPFHQMCEIFRTMPKATIAQIEARVGGGGSELAQAFDMRFGVVGRTVLSQMEVPLGILPGGGGTQRLPRLVGRSRALEIILGGDDFDAETLEKWGLLNRIFEPDQIDDYVTRLARRIASFPSEAITLAKQSVVAADVGLAEGLVEEGYLFQQSLRSDAAQARMRRFMDLGGQTRDIEMAVGDVVGRLGDD